MASKKSEILKKLKKFGWVLHKNGTNHFIYAKDSKLIVVPKGRKIYTRSYKQILLQIEGRACGKQDVQLSLDI